MLCSNYIEKNITSVTVKRVGNITERLPLQIIQLNILVELKNAIGIVFSLDDDIIWFYYLMNAIVKKKKKNGYLSILLYITNKRD